MERRADLPTSLVTLGRSLFVLCVMAGAALAPALVWAGALRGSVLFVGTSPGARKVAVTTDQYVCGKEKDAEDLVVSRDRGIKNAVVWLQTAPSGTKWEGPSPPVQTDQKECVFVPRVVVVPAGGTVEFLNNDRLLHNLHAASPRENPPSTAPNPRVGRFRSCSNGRRSSAWTAISTLGCARGWWSLSIPSTLSLMSRVNSRSRTFRQDSTRCRSGRKVWERWPEPSQWAMHPSRR